MADDWRQNVRLAILLMALRFKINNVISLYNDNSEKIVDDQIKQQM